MRKKTVKIISWNVNGLRAVVKKGFFDFIKNEKPDIFCLQETKAHEDQLGFDIKNFDDYTSFFSSSYKRGYSGVATYTKIKPLSISNSIGEDDYDKEGRILITEFNNFSLLNIYFPNGQMGEERLNYKLHFYNHILEFLRKYSIKQPNIVICGDVNTAHKEIDLFHPKENSKRSGFLPIERSWIDKLLNLGFLDSFRKFNIKPFQYTWWDLKSHARSRNVGWRIDYFFVSKKLSIHLKNASILSNIYGSDHCPINIELEFI